KFRAGGEIGRLERGWAERGRVTEPPRMSDDDSTRSAGRGGLAVAGAKIYFILLGLVQQVALPRVLGLDGYGAFMRVLSLSGIAYNPITSMSIQAMSRTVVHARPEELAATVRRVLGLEVLFGAGVGTVVVGWR